MDSSPCLNHLELFDRKLSCKQFTVAANRSLIFRIIDMKMRFVMLALI